MSRLTQRLFPAAGLLVALFASLVAVRAWRGERSLAEGLAAQRRGRLDAASVAYQAAIGCGSATAAAELARLQMLRLDWNGARGSLREARALAPTRGLPHVLQARLDLIIPGPWDDAREERVLDSCRIATALEPNRIFVKRECEIVTERLSELRRQSK